jgi:hypothetical protein
MSCTAKIRTLCLLLPQSSIHFLLFFSILDIFHQFCKEQLMGQKILERFLLWRLNSWTLSL